MVSHISFSIELDNSEHVAVNSRLLGACSFAEFCWFCCLSPKNESHLPIKRRGCVEALGNGALRDNRQPKDYFRFARQPGAIAINSYKPTFRY
jgi:hypothetical protein